MANRRIQSCEFPPYVSYATWQRLLEGLKPTPPIKMDRSFYDGLGFSGTEIFTLKAALYFFDLVNRDDTPTEKLHQLVKAKGERRKEILNNIVREAYAHLLTELDVQKATPGQLADYFEKLYAGGDKQRKCISFFLAIASEAGIELSPYLLRRAAAGVRMYEMIPDELRDELDALSPDKAIVVLEALNKFHNTMEAEIYELARHLIQTIR